MHSRVFQMSTEPLTVDDYAEDYELADMGKADYVIASDRDDDIAWLKECSPGIEISDDNSYLVVSSKEEYFKNNYEKFLEAVKEASTMPLSLFISCQSFSTVYRIESSYEEEYSFRVLLDDCVYSFDDFVRTAEEGKKYFIGSTFDYHI